MAEMPRTVEVGVRVDPHRISVPVTALYGEPFIPDYAHHDDAACDLVSTNEGYIRAGQRFTFGTGLAFAIPEGYAGFIWPRSGLAARQGIAVLGGVIDAGYRGEVKVVLLNTDTENDVHIEAGDRIAQLVIQPVLRAVFVPVTLAQLTSTQRGTGGFGSTGS